MGLRHLDCTPRHGARGATLALGLHHTATAKIAANELLWHNIEYRV
jgi:hypothetical protein